MQPHTLRVVCLMAVVVAATACANQKPVVYPNAHSQSVGQQQTDVDISECDRLARNAGASPNNSNVDDTAKRTVRGGAIGAATGAVGGAISGSAGQGAKIGAATGATASLIHGLFRESKPNSTYRRFVERCMSDRGYDIAGW